MMNSNRTNIRFKGQKSGKPNEEKFARTKQIESSLLDYYRNINDQLTEGFSEDSHKELFLSNVFEQLVKDGLKVSRHQSTSFTVEKLVRLANAEQLRQLLQVFCSNFNECITDRSTSYVLQTILYKCTQFLTHNEDDPFVRLLHQFGMQLLERSDLITSSHASHVIRTLAEVMAGVKVQANVVKGKHARQGSEESDLFTPHDLYPEFQDLLTALASRVFPVSSDTSSLIENTHTAALAQTFLLVFKEKNPAYCRSLCDAVINSGNLSHLDSDGLPALFVGQTSSYFVSALVKVLSADELDGILNGIIIPHLQALTRHPQANFVVQDIIENIHTAEQLTTLCDHLQDHLSHLLSSNKGGILVKMATVCQRFPKCQPRFIQILLSSVVGSDDPSDLFLGLAAFNSYTADENELIRELRKIDYIRSVILQKMFGFADCTALCEGLMKLTAKCLVALATNKFGSFVLDSFLKSFTVHPSKKKAFAEANQDTYLVMAKDKFGSRVFEAIWDVMSVPTQRQVMELLSRNKTTLSYSEYGRIVAYKIHLSDYMHRRQVWEKWQIEVNKERKMASIAELKVTKKAKKRLRDQTQQDSSAKNKTERNNSPSNKEIEAPTTELITDANKKLETKAKKKKERPEPKPIVEDSNMSKSVTTNSTSSDSSPKKKKAKKANDESGDKETVRTTAGKPRLVISDKAEDKSPQVKEKGVSIERKCEEMKNSSVLISKTKLKTKKRKKSTMNNFNS